MWTRVNGALTVIAFGIVFVAAQAASAQPSMDAQGCCCVSKGAAFNCSNNTQGACLELQPKAPTFPKMADWKTAWNDYVAADEKAEAQKLRGGWIGEPCADLINPETGEPRGAPTGCCCFPPKDKPVCKGGMTGFDCTAQCAGLREGRLPSPCTWTAGACTQ